MSDWFERFGEGFTESWGESTEWGKKKTTPWIIVVAIVSGLIYAGSPGQDTSVTSDKAPTTTISEQQPPPSPSSGLISTTDEIAQIRRAIAAFNRTMREGGVASMNQNIDDCYADSAGRVKTLNSAIFCFTLDYLTSQKSGSQLQRNELQNVYVRIHTLLRGLGFNADDNTIARWASFAEEQYSQQDAPPPSEQSRPSGANPLSAPTQELPSYRSSPSEVVEEPQLIERAQPLYPRRAEEAGQEGYVELELTISPDGTVRQAIVVFAKPHGWFEEAALSAVRKWRYRPRYVSGRPVEARGIRARIDFVLRD